MKDELMEILRLLLREHRAGLLSVLITPQIKSLRQLRGPPLSAQ
jgi:hypothetical protein